jgi:hypothetical protein
MGGGVRGGVRGRRRGKKMRNDTTKGKQMEPKEEGGDEVGKGDVEMGR